MADEELDMEDTSTNVVNLEMALSEMSHYAEDVGPKLNKFVAELEARLDALNSTIASLTDLAEETAWTLSNIKPAARFLSTIAPKRTKEDDESSDK